MYNVVLISVVQQSDLVIHVHTFFLIFFSIMVYHRILNIYPVLYSRTLLFIHPIYNNLRLLTPNFQSIPSLLITEFFDTPLNSAPGASASLVSLSCP